MNTKLLMAASALFMALLGLSFSFLPAEILHYLNVSGSPMLSLLLQILGALFLAFAILNWMAKGSLIGGIYNRPLALGNFMHFAVGAISLMKGLLAGQGQPSVWLGTVIYAFFAVCFGLVIFGKAAVVAPTTVP
jgi:hypothetical protein